MILLVHMLFGAAIGSLADNVYVGVALALVSHYFADLFPHVEYLDSVEASIQEIKTGDPKKYIISIAKVLADFLLGLVVIFFFIGNASILYLYALIAVVPDGLTVVSNLFPNKLLATHNHFHTQILHYFTKKKKFSLFWRIATQVAIIAISVWLLIPRN